MHCGFCLPTCPTYVLWGEEMDSPARPHLPDAGRASTGEPLTDAMVGHFDACLGCMACVTACPSGVQYDRLIEATRAQVERRHRRPPRDRLLRAAIFALFPYPRRLRLLRGPLRRYQRSGLQRLVQRSGVLDRISPTLAAMEALAPAGAAGAAAARAGGRARRAPGRRRHAHRLRAARVLPAGQRGHRAGAGAGGLRRRHPARARAAAAR